MEGYRSYPEGRQPYSEKPYPDTPYAEKTYAGGTYGETASTEADYPESPSWYGERPPREPERYEPDRYDDRVRDADRAHDADRYDEPRREYDEPRREYDEPRRELPRPASAEPARASAPPPRSAPPPPVDPPPPTVARRSPPVAPGSPGPVGDGVYRSRRPGTAALIGVPAAVLEIPALLLLVHSAFGDSVSPSGVVSAVCLILALPLLAFGLYAVATGAVRAAGPNSVQAWLRPPVAYLTVALVLFLAAGLAG